MGVKDTTLFTPEKFTAWNKLSTDLSKADEVDFTLAIGDLQKLEKRKDTEGFKMVPFIQDSIFTNENLKKYQYELFTKLPFYNGLIYSPDKKSVRTAIYLNKDILNSAARKDFIVENLIPRVQKFEDETGITVHTSGMPYIRTLKLTKYY